MIRGRCDPPRAEQVECTWLSSAHPHERDAYLTFVEDTHTYYIRGKKSLGAVSSNYAKHHAPECLHMLSMCMMSYATSFCFDAGAAVKHARGGCAIEKHTTYRLRHRADPPVRGRVPARRCHPAHDVACSVTNVHDIPLHNYSALFLRSSSMQSRFEFSCSRPRSGVLCARVPPAVVIRLNIAPLLPPT